MSLGIASRRDINERMKEEYMDYKEELAGLEWMRDTIPRDNQQPKL
jgi:hypothetical protein